ncbi:MAG: hypothetical protein WC682_00615 [Parcubacteria group bacterium]|jgi:hypothetical protein
MENISFEKSKPTVVESGKDKGLELSGPNKRIIELSKKELGKILGFGLKSIEEDAELMEVAGKNFLENEGVLANKIMEWDKALSDINKDATIVESMLAKNFADSIANFIKEESKLKNRFNN